MEMRPQTPPFISQQNIILTKTIQLFQAAASPGWLGVARTAGPAPTLSALVGDAPACPATSSLSSPPAPPTVWSAAQPAITPPSTRRTRRPNLSTISTYTTTQVGHQSPKTIKKLPKIPFFFPKKINITHDHHQISNVALSLFCRNWYSQLLDVCNDHDSLHLHCICRCQHLHTVVSSPVHLAQDIFLV